MFKPITRIARGAISSSICKQKASAMMGPALLLTTMNKRTAVGTTKGAPPISIDDLYGLCFLSEPTVRPPVERPPQEMFDIDIRINEVVIYVNGGLHATKDKVSEDFVRHMFEASLVLINKIIIIIIHNHSRIFAKPLSSKYIKKKYIFIPKHILNENQKKLYNSIQVIW